MCLLFFSVSRQFISKTQLSELRGQKESMFPYRVTGDRFELKVRASLFSHLQHADGLPVPREVEGQTRPTQTLPGAWKRGCIPQGLDTSKGTAPLPLPKAPSCFLLQCLAISAEAGRLLHICHRRTHGPVAQPSPPNFKGRPFQIVFWACNTWGLASH